MSRERRRNMIERNRRGLSIARQCKLVAISRSSFYYQRHGESEFNLGLMRQIDATFLACPFYGSRPMTRHLVREGHLVGRKRIRRLMALMGLQAVHPRPRTSKPAPGHRIYPYLLRDLEITRPNQVWCVSVIAYMDPKRDRRNGAR